MLGGLLIGLIEVFWSGYFSIEYKDVAVFAHPRPGADLPADRPARPDRRSRRSEAMAQRSCRRRLSRTHQARPRRADSSPWCSASLLVGIEAVQHRQWPRGRRPAIGRSFCAAIAVAIVYFLMEMLGRAAVGCRWSSASPWSCSSPARTRRGSGPRRSAISCPSIPGWSLVRDAGAAVAGVRSLYLALGRSQGQPVKPMPAARLHRLRSAIQQALRPDPDRARHRLFPSCRSPTRRSSISRS